MHSGQLSHVGISLAQALEARFPNQYSESNRNKIARNAASSWTQSGHLAGRAKKIRQRIKPTVVAVTMAFFLGDVAGYHGTAGLAFEDELEAGLQLLGGLQAGVARRKTFSSAGSRSPNKRSAGTPTSTMECG